MTPISFNGYSLQSGLDDNPRISTVIQNHFQAPSVALQTETLATRHGRKFLNRYYTDKTIDVQGSITAHDSVTFEKALDDFKMAMSAKQANLDVSLHDGSVRRYICTATVTDLPHTGANAQMIFFKISFVCSTPFGQATATATYHHHGLTTSPQTFLDTFVGTAPMYPIFTITVNSRTSMTQLQIQNTDTGDRVIVDETFAPADIIIINALTGSVTKNGITIAFTGVFPEYPAGDNHTQITITDTGAFNVDLDIEYLPYYL